MVENHRLLTHRLLLPILLASTGRTAIQYRQLELTQKIDILQTIEMVRLPLPDAHPSKI